MSYYCIHSVHREKKPSFISKCLKNLAMKRLPSRMKRLMFISSALGFLYKVNASNMEVINNLNDILNVTKNPSAMAFPMYIKDVIWSDLSDDKIVINGRTMTISSIDLTSLSNNERADIADYFATNIPYWLRYSDIISIRNDLLLILNNSKLIFSMCK